MVFYNTMRERDWRELYAQGVRASSATPQTDAFTDQLHRLAGRTLPV